MDQDISTKASIAQGISDYYLYVLTGIGVPANFLAIITILTMQTVTPATFFVAVLATCDGLALVFKLLFLKLGSFNEIMCKLEFLPIFFTILANWMLVFICVERFISVCYPLKKAYLVTKSKSYLAVGLLWALLFVPLATLFSITREKKSTCGALIEYKYFWQNVWGPLGNSLAVFLPFFFIFFFTAAIIRGLWVSSRARRSLLRKDSTQRSKNNKSSSTNERQIAEAEKLERAITIMMTFTAVFFLVFSLPSCIYFCLKEPKDIPALVNYLLFEKIQYFLLDSTHALNFFLYVLTAKRFRGHLAKLLTCKRLRKIYQTRREAKQGKHRQSVCNTQTTNLEPNTSHGIK